MQNTSKLTPIKLEEIDTSNDITIKSYQNLVIPVGQILTIIANKKLIVEGAITNNGTIRNNGTYSGTAPNPRGNIEGTNAGQIS